MFLLDLFYKMQKKGKSPYREQVLYLHGQLVDKTLACTASGQLHLADDFTRRFELIIFLVALFIHELIQTKKVWHAQLAEALWETTFEGFEHSLRERGVTDLSIAKRMRKLFAQATGRRNAYLDALKTPNNAHLHQAIARNLFDGSAVDDERIAWVVSMGASFCQTLLANLPNE